MSRFDVIDDGWFFFSMKSLSHLSHNQQFYRRMMHEEDERPPNEKSHAYHFSIIYNGCDFCLLTPSAILALTKCQFKGWRLKFRCFICLRCCSSHYNWNWSALHKDEHKKDAKHKKLLNLLCIVYINHLIWCLYLYLDMYALKNIALSYSRYNVLLYLFIQTCYLNKSPLLGGITLFFTKKYFCNAVHTTQF